ncbi:MAG: ABC transporter ATP-binding protein, partial [Weissella confusa]
MDRGQSVETEAFQRPAKFDMKAFMRLIRQTKPAYWQLGLGLGLGVIATGIQLAVPHFAGDLINGFGKSIDKTLLVSVIGMFILSAVISALSGTVLGIFGENVVSRLRNTLWDKLIRLRVAYFDETKAGEMTSRLINDSTQIKDLLANSFPRMITSLLTVVGALTLMVLKDWRMTAIMALAIPLVMLVMLPVMRQSHKVGRDRQNSLADFNGAAGETLSEIRLVKSSNAEPFETEKGHTTIQSLYKIGLREAVYDSVAGPLMTAVMMGLFVGVLAYGAHRVSQGTM